MAEGDARDDAEQNPKGEIAFEFGHEETPAPDGGFFQMVSGLV
jgi:hypothetical protein